MKEIEYTIISTDSLKTKEREYIDNIVSTIKTVEQAKALQLTCGSCDRKVCWSNRFYSLGSDVRVMVLLFHTYEVALFWRRACTKLRHEPINPLPEDAVAADPDEPWIRVELLHTKAAKKRNSFYSKDVGALQNQVDHLEGLQRALLTELDAAHAKNIELEMQLQKKKANG